MVLILIYFIKNIKYSAKSKKKLKNKYSAKRDNEFF